MIEFPKLPYAEDALAPIISANTLSFHYGKHHKTYVDNLNNLIKGTELESMALTDIIAKVAGDAAKVGVFNNAAQTWNHTFFWNSMNPKGARKPSGKLAALIEESFGGYDGVTSALQNAAVGQFGSGWAWLVQNNAGKLEVVKTGNADTPMVSGLTPLLTIDVWEHAYYLDYQNRRADFVKSVIEHLLDWDFAAQNLTK
jgi:Fe-Mn family superoxide dismutase